MPISITNESGGANYGNPFVGPVDHTAVVKVDISAMTNAEIDSKGYLKPGVPFKENGTLIGSGEKLFGVTIEAIKVAAGNESADLSGATDCFVAVGTVGQISQDIAEDNLGRSYTADEIASFNLAGSKIVLLPT